jgi:hypothetical protein
VNYTINGISGYLYQSVKDQLKWNNISVKEYTNSLMHIGTMIYGSDEYFAKSISRLEMNGPDKNAGQEILAMFGKVLPQNKDTNHNPMAP